MLRHRVYEEGDWVDCEEGFVIGDLSHKRLIRTIFNPVGEICAIIAMEYHCVISVVAFTDQAKVAGCVRQYIRTVKSLLDTEMILCDLPQVETLMLREGAHIKWIRLLGFVFDGPYDDRYDNYIYVRRRHV